MKTTIIFLSLLLAFIISATAQNTVIFDNQSGEPALVKLIGPTSTQIEVSDSSKQPVQALAGKYIIKVRYGVQGEYRYTKGREFTVDETPTSTSETTITLHKVVNGNYGSSPISEQEFGVENPVNAATIGDTKANESKDILDAARDGDLEKVKLLLKGNPDLVSNKDEDGATLLHWAAGNGQNEVVELLLTNKAQVNAKANSGYTPLHGAVSKGYKNVVELLLASGADVNANSIEDVTP